MEIKAKISYVRISSRKIRLIANGLRGLKPKEALQRLQFHPQAGKEFLVKLIKQGVANAVNNFKLSEDDLIIKIIEINDGPGLKRMDKSHGARFDRGLIKKRSSRLSLILTEKEEKVDKEVTKKVVKVRRKNGSKS